MTSQHRPRTLPAVTAAVLTGLLLAGCSTPQHPTAGTPAPTVNLHGWTPTQAAPATPTATAAPAVDGPVTVATAFMTAFCHTTLPATDWYAGIRDDLTPYAQTAYQGTDPARVPGHQVTGAGTLSTVSDVAATVTVPTDAGDYQVQLSRTDPAAAWLVDRAIPPAGAR